MPAVLGLSPPVTDHGGPARPACRWREQVERADSAPSGAGRRDGDGRALERPADRRGFPVRSPPAEQDAPAPRQPAHEGPVQKLGSTVEIGLGVPAALSAAETLDPAERRRSPEHGQHHDGGRRDDEQDQPEPFERLQSVDAGPERRPRHRRPRALELPTDPEPRALAIVRHAVRERRRNRHSETGSRDFVRAAPAVRRRCRPYCGPARPGDATVRMAPPRCPRPSHPQ